MEGAFSRFPVRVAAAIRNAAGELLVVRHSRGGRPYWTFPGGSLNMGEALGAAVVREVAEETGYTLELGDIIAVAEIGGTQWDAPTLEILFAGLVDTEGQPAPRASDEALQAQWRRPDEIAETFLPRQLLAAVIERRVGSYCGNITERLEPERS